MLVSSIFEFRSPYGTPIGFMFLLFLYKSYAYNLILIPTLGPKFRILGFLKNPKLVKSWGFLLPDNNR